MLNEEIRTLLKAHPFVPFSVQLGDETRHLVHHPDYAFLSPLGQVLEIWEPDGVIKHLLHVSQIKKISATYPQDESPVSAGNRG